MKNNFWMLFTYRSFSVTWCTGCFGKRTEGQWRGRRRLRRTGAVDTKSPAKQNIEGSLETKFLCRSRVDTNLD